VTTGTILISVYEIYMFVVYAILISILQSVPSRENSRQSCVIDRCLGDKRPLRGNLKQQRLTVAYV